MWCGMSHGVLCIVFYEPLCLLCNGFCLSVHSFLLLLLIYQSCDVKLSLISVSGKMIENVL